VRDKDAVAVGFEHDLQQVAAVQAEDRPAVGADVADAFQSLLEFLHRIQRRKKDHVVNFAHLAVFFIDAADLAERIKRTGDWQAEGTSGCTVRASSSLSLNRPAADSSASSFSRISANTADG